MKWPFGERARSEAEIREELEGHLQMAADERVTRGETADEAVHAAHREFGNVGQITESTREVWTRSWLEGGKRDLGLALRVLMRNPLFTLVTIVSLGLGIGATTAVFSVIEALLLRPLPVAHASELVNFIYPDDPFGFSYPSFERYREAAHAFENMTAIAQIDRANVTIGDGRGEIAGEQARVGLVSGSYFATFGVHAIRGVGLSAADDRIPGGHPVAVVSYDFWVRRFAQSDDVVGRTLALSGVTYQIVGVTEPGFRGEWVGRPTDLWIPIAMQAQVMPERPDLLTNPGPPWLRIVGRLKSGITLERAQAEVDVIYPRTIQAQNLNPRQLEGARHTRVELESGAKGYSP